MTVEELIAVLQKRDVVGLDEKCELKEAIERLKAWRKSFPNETCRLIVRVDMVAPNNEIMENG